MTATARTVLLVVNTGRDEARETARNIGKTLAANAIGLRVLSTEALDMGEQVQTVEGDGSLADGCELVLVLGGDGTFLRAAELARDANIPVLGINLGRIGFLAEAEAESIDAILGHIVARDYRVEHRMTLDVVVSADGEVLYSGWALNEASLERAGHRGVLGVMVAIDGRPVSAFGCDGVLVSSPTGSTAYAFSSGGPVVWPDLEAIIVVPNNAHALFARPMVTNPNAVITVDVDTDNPESVVVCDGRREAVVPAGARLQVTKCRTPLKWVRLDSAPFTDRLVRKFRLPVTSWRER
ncbi:MAG TPA: NAD kinase [Mycobacterium sp.]|nr:NAD kinase [Mycobacterium sp.]